MTGESNHEVGVKISQIHIENYRLHRDTAVNLEGLTAFIGRNGTGKSSVLYAIDFFYDVSAVLTDDDIYAGADEEVAITVVYSDLSQAELAEFELYVRDGVLTVIKRARAGQPGRYYGIVPQLPEFVQVRATRGAVPQRTAYNEVRGSGRFPGLPTVGNQGEVVTAMDNFERDPANAAHLELFERQEQFFGDRRAGAGRLDNFTSFVLVPAVHEAASESEKSGAIQILVDRLVTSALANRDDIVQFRTEFEERFAETYAPENLSEIERVSDAVNALLSRYAPGLGLRLTWKDAVPPPFGLPAFNTRLGDEAYDTPIALQGHGMQRALVLSLLQLMALQRENPPEGEDGDHQTPDLIVAIEEPELYLHPAQCRYLAKLLSQLSAEAEPPGTQVLYATHSPYFVHMDGFEQIRVLRRRAPAEGEIPCCETGSLGFEVVQTEIARIAEIEPATITRDSFLARCTSVMDTVASEGFFASAAVIVEGYGDLGCLRAVEQRLGLQWDEKGIVIVPARSKNSIDRPVHIFRGFGIPCYFLFDGDDSRRGTNKEADAARTNRLLMRLAGADPEDFPVTQVHPGWAALADKLETEFKSAFETDEDWDSVAGAVRDELEFAAVKQTLKNPDGVAALVHRIYEEGGTLPVIEEIARRVTELVE
ncbi:MAG: ATP-dependent nuclease [Thermoleophilia bacterium]